MQLALAHLLLPSPSLFSFFSRPSPRPSTHRRPATSPPTPVSHVLASRYRRSDVFAHPPFAPVLIIASQQPLKCHPGKVPGTDLSSTRRYFEKGREKIAVSLLPTRANATFHLHHPLSLSLLFPPSFFSYLLACILFEVTNVDKNGELFVTLIVHLLSFSPFESRLLFESFLSHFLSFLDTNIAYGGNRN